MRTIASSSDRVTATIPVEGLATLPAVLHTLRDSPPVGPVLSVYLDTSPVRVEAGGHLLALRAGVKRIRAGDASPSAEVGKAFEEAVAQIEQYLLQTERLDHPGWACFSTSDPEFFYATPLPRIVDDAVIWSTAPAIAPLEQALDEYQRVAVLLFDAEESRLYSMFLGEIVQTAAFRDYVPSKHHGGGWLALDEGKQTRHREAKLLQHAQHATKELLRQLRAQPFDRLIVAGPDESVSFLIHQLPTVLAHRLVGTAKIEFFATQDEIRREATTIAERAERDAEAIEVGQLFDAATTGKATLGVESVLAALSDLSVRRLVIASDFVGHGAYCLKCERLLLSDACPICGDKTTPVEDSREALISSARAIGASVEFVSGRAGDQLLTVGGLGAWTRF
jgi:peptide subunit release factor 1 (eRF1)